MVDDLSDYVHGLDERLQLAMCSYKACQAEFSFEVKIGYDEDVLLIAWRKPSNLI